MIYRRIERGAWSAKFHLSYNILLPRRPDSWLPSPFPRVCTVKVRSYTDVMTKFSRMMDRLPHFLAMRFCSPAPGAPLIGTLRSNYADANENVKKTIGLISKITTSHVHYTFSYISFPFLHYYDVKMPNFALYGGRTCKQATTKLYFSFWAWRWSLEIQLQEGSPTIDKVSGYE